MSAIAAFEAGANGPTTICIAFDAGVSTGKDTCWLINNIVREAVKEGVPQYKAEKWTERAVHKRYTWYQGYESLCGKRPSCDCPDKSNGDVCTTEHLCGESDCVYAAWTAARSKVWQSGGCAETLIEEATKAALKAGATNKQAACISVVAGVSSGMETCPLINYTVQWWIYKGVSAKTAEGWIDDGVHKRYTWYTNYKDLCGNRPCYADHKSG